MPNINVLHKSSAEWNSFQVKTLRVTVPDSRNIECVRLSLKTVVEHQLSTLQNMDIWPEPPSCGLTSSYDEDKVVVLCLSIDSGTESTKFMAKFLRDGGGQKNVLKALFAYCG